MREAVHLWDGKAGVEYRVDETRAAIPVLHEHRIVCPFCRTARIFNSPMEVILLPRSECRKGSKEFLIENSAAKRLRGKKRPRKSR